jgi:uncharacterized protein YjbI with pentapeptide repeats
MEVFGMSVDLLDVFMGWLLGSATSLIVIWLEGKREIQREIYKQRLEDIRTVRNYAHSINKGRPSFRGYDLTGANLSGKDLSETDLEDVILKDAKIWGANFSGANLIRANFRNAKLVEVDFTDADLRLADFAGAELIEANFSRARLRRTMLKHAKRVEKCIWESAGIDETTELNASLQSEIAELSLAKPTDRKNGYNEHKDNE